MKLRYLVISVVSVSAASDFADFENQPCDPLIKQPCGTSGFLQCGDSSLDDGIELKCIHKPIFPLLNSEIAGTIVLTLLMALAVMSGIGGGGVIVPLLMVFYQLNTQKAIAISGFTILAGSICRYLVTLNHRHPTKDATCIEYSLSNVMLPTVMMGSVTGVYFANFLPPLVTQILLTLLLLFLAVQSAFKAKMIYQTEKKVALERHNSMNPSNNQDLNVDEPLQRPTVRAMTYVFDYMFTEIDQAPMLIRGNTINNKDNKSVLSDDTISVRSESKQDMEYQQLVLPFKQELKRVLHMERHHKQWCKHFNNFIIFAVLAAVKLYNKRNGDRCSKWAWISQGLFVLVCLVISFFSLRRIKREQWLKVNYGKGLSESDIDLQGSTLTKLLTFSFFGGWVSGALGLGGGSIFNPLLLSMGVPPKVASATGMYMIIFSTGASSLIYIIQEDLNIYYGLWIGGFCIIGTISGMYLLEKLMDRIARQSPLVMLLTLILAISAFAVPYFGLQQLKGKENPMTWGNICG